VPSIMTRPSPRRTRHASIQTMRGLCDTGGDSHLRGRPQDAIGLWSRQCASNPQQQADYAWALVMLISDGSIREANFAAFKRALIRYPNLCLPTLPGAIYSELDREEEARAALAEFRKITPAPQQAVSGDCHTKTKRSSTRCVLPGNSADS